MDSSYNLTGAPALTKYSLEEILEMLGGFSYFSEEQVLYAFHKSNGNLEQEKYYLAICLEQALKLQEKSHLMKDVTEIAPLEIIGPVAENEMTNV